MSSRRRLLHSAKAGYALPMTLAAIIVIALVSAIAAQQLRASTQSVTRLTDHVRAEASLLSAEQTLIYLMLTEPMGMRGVEVGARGDVMTNLDTTGSTPVPANGTPFRLNKNEPIFVRLLAPQSFLNLASANEQALSEALSLFGVPDADHQAMFAALQDYQDDDDFRRLGGAEASDYEVQGLPPNRPLREVLETCSVKGWRESAVCADRGRLLLLGAVRDNDTLIPRLTSETLLGEIQGDSERAADAFERYASGEWRSFDQIGAPEFDAIRDPLGGGGTPGPQLIIISHSAAGTNARRTIVELTPNSLQSPFRIKSRYAIAGTYVENALRIERPSDVTPLPEPTANAFRR